MDERLRISYDKIGDLLFIDVCPTYAEQDSNEIDESVVARFNLTTGNIETVEILFFYSWLKKEGQIRIPVSATLWLANAAPPNAIAPSSMDATLAIGYDQTGDTLTLEQRPPHPGQNRAEICEGVSAGFNPEMGAIENLEIHSFKARMEKEGEIVLPINATLQPVKSAVPAD